MVTSVNLLLVCKLELLASLVIVCHLSWSQVPPKFLQLKALTIPDLPWPCLWRRWFHLAQLLSHGRFHTCSTRTGLRLSLKSWIITLSVTVVRWATSTPSPSIIRLAVEDQTNGFSSYPTWQWSRKEMRWKSMKDTNQKEEALLLCVEPSQLSNVIKFSPSPKFIAYSLACPITMPNFVPYWSLCQVWPHQVWAMRAVPLWRSGADRFSGLCLRRPPDHSKAWSDLLPCPRPWLSSTLFVARFCHSFDPCGCFFFGFGCYNYIFTMRTFR